jgi:hypothetical protein
MISDDVVLMCVQSLLVTKSGYAMYKQRLNLKVERCFTQVRNASILKGQIKNADGRHDWLVDRFEGFVRLHGNHYASTMLGSRCLIGKQNPLVVISEQKKLLPHFRTFQK